jgi:hypothetical protein
MVSEQVLISIAALLGLVIVSISMLRGWQGWLALKERELDRGRHEIEGGVASGMQRIELADLKERIRKLEAIAAGIDF